MNILDYARVLRATVSPAEKKPEITSLIARPQTRAADWQIIGQQSLHERLGQRPAVGGSEDLNRILALPKRARITEDSPEAGAVIKRMTERLRRHNPSCACPLRCITELKLAQAWALEEISTVGGLLGAIGVGHGKTGLDILTPLVMPGCKVAVLLVPPKLQEQLKRDYLAWREHFRVPSIVFMDNTGWIVSGAPVLHVIPYSRLSRPEATDLLEKIMPDTFILDEAHKARHPKTAGTGRIVRYCAQHPDTRVVSWSGTVTSASIKDYSHLLAFGLKSGSPLPLDANVVQEWALAIDPSDWPAPIGKLAQFCEPGEHIHQGFHRRLVETPGVVSTTQGAVDASIVISERHVSTPKYISQILAVVRETMVRPDGEELVDALSVQACARQLACGFYYRWRFPKGEPEALILKWFAARKAWHKELREKLKTGREHLDSPFLCTNAAIRHYDRYDGPLPTWKAETWPAWHAIRDSVYHETEPVWVDDFLVADAAEWARKHKGVLWYEHNAFGRKVAALAGLPLYGGGGDALCLPTDTPEVRAKAAVVETGARSVILSIPSYYQGLDGLQYLFSHQLVANPPASGDAWEQLLGRLHRTGFPGDEMHTLIYRHTDEYRDAWDSARMKAEYIQGTMGNLQKLLAANVEF